MQEMSDFHNPFECLWTEITNLNSEFYCEIVYHPPNPEYNDKDLIEFFIDFCEQLLSAKPNSKIIIDGDVNQLDIRNL